MSLGDRLGIVGLIVAFVAIATTYLWPDKKWIGWISLCVAGVLLLAWAVLEIRQKSGATQLPMLSSLAIGGVVGMTIAALIWYSASPKPTNQLPDQGTAPGPKTPGPAPQRPEVALRFVYPEAPALVIANPSDVIARDIKWTVVLWNRDLPDRMDPLPIPVSTFDWIRPHDQSGAQNLFSAPPMASLLKAGNRLYGSASAICPECSRGRSYVLYIEWGRDGWYSEVTDETSGKLFIPANFRKDTREAYFRQVEAIPPTTRIPISGP
jgi:hypothetical protein